MLITFSTTKVRDDLWEAKVAGIEGALVRSHSLEEARRNLKTLMLRIAADMVDGKDWAEPNAIYFVEVKE